MRLQIADHPSEPSIYRCAPNCLLLNKSNASARLRFDGDDHRGAGVSALTLDDGSPLVLGAVLAKAGEGTIFEVDGRKELVAKVFHATLTDLPTKLDKVKAMIAGPPPRATQADGFVVLTWPQQLISDAGQPVGYVMHRVDTASAVEIHSISNPFNRSNPLPGAPQWTADATWTHLVSVAANLCLAVEVVHSVDAVIGDFQERNILVSDTTRVTLVDCDSMQITDPTGRQFLCGVGRPEFTAPELTEVDLRTQSRHKQSDLFALAVHIYLLLMGGNHPFMRGVWTGAGEQPAALSLANAGYFAGGPDSPLAAHPLAPPLSFLPAEVSGLFIRAFADGANGAGRRPTAHEWRRALSQIRTTECAQGNHHIPDKTSECPWCAIDAERTRRKRSLPIRDRLAPAGWSDDLLNAPIQWPAGLSGPVPFMMSAPVSWPGGFPAGPPPPGDSIMVNGHALWPTAFPGAVPTAHRPPNTLGPKATGNPRTIAMAIFLAAIGVAIVVGLVVIFWALARINSTEDSGPPATEAPNSQHLARSATAVDPPETTARQGIATVRRATTNFQPGPEVT